MENMSVKTRMYVLIALVVVVALAVVFLGVMPLFQRAADLRTQIQAEKTNLMAATAVLERRQSAKAQSAANEAELMAIANEMPDSPQLPSVIIELQDVANDAGVDLEEITPAGLTDPEGTARDEEPPYKVLPIIALVQGDWADLIVFLRGIDDLDRGVRVRAVTFDYQEATDDEPWCVRANVSLEAYVLAAATTAPAPSALPSSEPSGSPGSMEGTQ